MFFTALIVTLAIYIYRGEPFTAALLSAFSSAAAVFLSWAVGREFDPAFEWSAFIPLPVIYIVFFAAGRPSLLTLLFIILCCRLLNRASGLQPLKSDALLLSVLAVLLYFNNFYFTFPYLMLVFLSDALVKPVNRFQYVSAMVSFTLYLILFIAFRPQFTLALHETIPVVYPAAAVIIVVLSAIYVSYVTRHEKVLDDLNKTELSNLRVSAARFLAAVWIGSEILCGGLIILFQTYPVIFIFGGIFLYHLVEFLRRQKRNSYSIH